MPHPPLEEETALELRDFVHILQRFWALILATVVVGAVLATGYSLLKTPQYQSTSKAIISVASATSSSDLIQGGTYLQQVVGTYANVATTPYVLNPVIRQLKLKETAAELSDRVTANSPVGQTVIEVTVTDRSSREAAAISNAIIQRLATAVQSVAPNSQNRTASIRVTLLQSAVPSTFPSSPNVPLNVGLGVVIGLLLGLVLAISRSRTDVRITTSSDVERVTDHPVLGTVAFRRSAVAEPIASDPEKQLLRREEFRLLRSRILRTIGRGKSSTVLVTSATSGQGTSTTAANLAIAFADVGSNVALVDANPQHASIDGYFGIGGGPGLLEVLRGTDELSDALVRSSRRHLSILPAGAKSEDAPDLLTSGRMTAVIDDLNTRFQVVIIDSAPVLTNPESLSIARRVNGVLIVSAVGRSDRVRLRRALDDLDDAGAWVLGIVVTMAAAVRLGRRRRPQPPTRSESDAELSPAASPSS